jgi:hypothetical protein
MLAPMGRLSIQILQTAAYHNNQARRCCQLADSMVTDFRMTSAHQAAPGDSCICP